MELSEFLKLLKKNLGLFLMTVFVFVFAGLIFYQYQSQKYIGTIAVNISREGKNENKNYQYDQFYRLQADEKFGQNVVNWVSDQGFREENRKDFNQEQEGAWKNISKIKALQLSANYIKITFISEDFQSAFSLAKVLKENLQEKNQEINFNESENWFKLIIDEPYISKNSLNIYFVFLSTLILGTFFGITGVLFKNYFKNENRN
jgi:capsular polysaccharide biosynthesis protein